MNIYEHCGRAVAATGVHHEEGERAARRRGRSYSSSWLSMAAMASHPRMRPSVSWWAVYKKNSVLTNIWRTIWVFRRDVTVRLAMAYLR